MLLCGHQTLLTRGTWVPGVLGLILEQVGLGEATEVAVALGGALRCLGWHGDPRGAQTGEVSILWDPSDGGGRQEPLRAPGGSTE